MLRFDYVGGLFEKLRVEHDVMVWLADSSITMDAMPNLCIVEGKTPTSIFSQLSMTKAGLESVVLLD